MGRGRGYGDTQDGLARLQEIDPEYSPGTVRKVLTLPNPLLKQPCEAVLDVNAMAVSLLDDLVETMISLPRCVGLAAPQIGVTLRAVVVDVSRNPRQELVGKNHGLLCMLNPLVRFSAGTQVSREGCASVPEFTANVTRAQHVVVSYLDYHGAEKTVEASGFEAIALQHEVDHLDGRLFLDRVTPSDVFRRKAPQSKLK